MEILTRQQRVTTLIRSIRDSSWIGCPQGLGGMAALALALLLASLTSCQVGEISMTLEAEATATIPAATSTTGPTLALASSSPTPNITEAADCTNQAEFVADLTFPDGSRLAAGEVFLKTWRLRNSGTCTWDQTYTLFLAGGHRMDAVDSQPLPEDVAPGATVDLTIAMTAPQADGNYRGDWLLMDSNGSAFGIGPDGISPFWVSIVVGTGSDPGKATPVSDTPAAGICGRVEGDVATMTINPDVPDPRCLSVTANQRLRVVNHGGQPLTITLFNQTAVIPTGDEYTFDASFGDLLLPGVHYLEVSPCCGGSIWLQEP